jgi:serine phosphatase RsbU (regulator of sigma subunit)
VPPPPWPTCATPSGPTRRRGGGPAVILTKLGELVGQPEDGYFATVLCGSLDVDCHLLTVASAGHFAPLVIDGGTARYVDMEVGPPIGVLPQTGPAEVTITVPPGAALVVVTDGLVERRGEHLDVGLARLAEVAADHRGSIDDLLGRLLVDLAPAGSDDDIAILGVQWQA